MIETTESISVQVTDGADHVATLQCSYIPGKRVNVSVVLTSGYQAERHQTLVEDALTSFQAEVLARLIAADMPVPAKS